MSVKTSRLFRPDEYDRHPNDFYQTPAWVSQCLLDTVSLRGMVWEPCAGQGAMAKVVAAAGYQVVASDLSWMDGNVFPVVGGVDALQSLLPAGVRSIVSNPPYQQEVLRPLVDHWLNLLEPVDGQLCLLLRSGWGESQKGQTQTTKHPAYHGRIKLPRRVRWLEGTTEDKGGSPQHDHCWLVWDWSRCQPTRGTDPLATLRTDPRWLGLSR